jgi:hypothetical protein
MARNRPDAADVNDAIAGATPVAAVALEYSQIESQRGSSMEFDDPDRVVTFYVYKVVQRLYVNWPHFSQLVNGRRLPRTNRYLSRRISKAVSASPRSIGSNHCHPANLPTHFKSF